MKPTKQQLTGLQEYLHKTLNYRESYEEIYDHIISALEHEQESINFQLAVNNIIIKDFGGHDNLLKVENGIKAAAIEEAKKEFIKCLKSILTFPTINYTIAMGLTLYVILRNQNISHLVLGFIGFALIFTPSIISLIRYFKVGYLFGDQGNSLRDEAFRYLSYRQIWVFSMILLYLPGWGIIKFNVWNNEYPLITTFYLLVPLVYNMIILKLYKSEVDLNKAI